MANVSTEEQGGVTVHTISLDRESNQSAWYVPLRKSRKQGRPTVPTHRAGKAAPAARVLPRHKHDWLVRYDYMQCRTCGILVTTKDRPD